MYTEQSTTQPRWNEVNKTVSFAATQMNLEITRQSEVSQRKTNTIRYH